MNKSDFALRYGPVALVTGASSGIGKSFAQVLAGKGLDLVLVARRRNRLEELASRLENEFGIRVTVSETDLSSPTAAQKILECTASMDVGLVVSNAGFGLKGGYEAGVRAVESVELLSHLANLGDTRSLIIHPASTTHRQLTEEQQIASGAGPDVVRLSIGLETVDDIIADLDQALSYAQAKAAE